MADSSRSAGQSGGAPAGAAGVVFVHTNDPDANEIIAYRREGTGALVREAAYATQGAGGVQEGAPADPLASQHSLVHDERTGQLYVVNAGSDSLSVFGVDGARLQWRQTVPTDGEFPASVAVARGLVYVLNAGGDGGVSGYQVESDGLRPLPGSARRLGLGNSRIPFFLSSPGQVGFSPDGRYLLVTTKNHNQILVFTVGDDGLLSPDPVVTSSAGPVPFSFVFDAAGHLVVAEASGALSSYTLSGDASLSAISPSVRNRQQATCWLVSAKGFLYAVNAGSGTISGYAIDGAGRLRLLKASGVSATVGTGAIDAAVSSDQEYLHVENGATATIHSYRVADDGSLVPLAETTGLPRFDGHSVEGIAAT